MYPLDLYYAFVQLRKQLYKCKTVNWQWKYTCIEQNKAKFKTFQVFYDEAYEYLWNLWGENCYTIQEVFDKMLDYSQSKKKLKWLCF